MLRLVAGTVLLFLMGLTEALAVEKQKRTTSVFGNEATFKNNKFDHCAISRKSMRLASFPRVMD
jgi:hypothetical protein